MKTYQLIFDLGAEYVCGATKDDGFYDKIPSAVAYQGDSKQIVAVGVDAVKLSHQQGIKIVNPILEGAVIDAEGARALIVAMLNRLINKQLTAFSRYNVWCVIPCGINSSDKRAIETIFLGLGIKQVDFVETPIADSLQVFSEFRIRQGVIVDIGHDCTDIAVVNGDNIVSGCTVCHSGKHLTLAIIERIKNKYMIQISYEQAEQLKVNCASLYANDTSVVQVSGQNIQHGHQEVVSISAKELYDTLVDFVSKYVLVIKGLLSAVPQEILSYVKTGGVILCGGGSKLAGLDMFLHGELNLPIRVADKIDDVSVLGMLQYDKQ